MVPLSSRLLHELSLRSGTGKGLEISIADELAAPKSCVLETVGKNGHLLPPWESEVRQPPSKFAILEGLKLRESRTMVSPWFGDCLGIRMLLSIFELEGPEVS
jgi:hypothetical protein